MNATDFHTLTPSRDAQRTALPEARRWRRGLEAWLDGWHGRWRQRSAVRQEWAALADQAAAAMRSHCDTPEPQLTAALQAMRTDWRREPQPTRDQLVAALGLVAEAARRRTGLEAHREQLMGAIGLWDGALVEIATGEGKTLTLARGALGRGGQGRPCHVVTANDYLARRDAHGLRRFYALGGLTVGEVVAGQPADQRRAAYAADICYTTAKELLADFLRDRLTLGRWAESARRSVRSLGRDVTGRDRTVLRGVHAVLVDEADHILIDEAVTPLIISRPRPNAELSAASVEAAALARGIDAGDYRVDRIAQEIELGPALRRRIRDEWTPAARVLHNLRWREELVRQALRAREFFRRDQHYLVRDGRVVIIDESTGRPQDQRSWRQGLHQMIEAQEGLPPTDPSDTLASVSFQQFFRRVPVLAGVSGTAAEEAAELWRVYRLPVVALPTHQPCIRKVGRARVFATAGARWSAVVAEVRRLHEAGRPVLVGTRSVAASEELARRFALEEIPCAVLNARQLDREAEIVAEAGRPGCVTIATNLAGRGTDIHLGAGVAAQGGLVVVATERHGAARVDRQLFGRAARQGDPGEVWPAASLDDELARRELPAWFRRLLARGIERDFPGAERLAGGSLRVAQALSGRRLARQRQGVTELDEHQALYWGGNG